MGQKENIKIVAIDTNEEIRKLVLARLKMRSSETMTSIGDEGVFTRDQLIDHVQAGDKIGKTVQEIEMKWLSALKNGIVTQLHSV